MSTHMGIFFYYKYNYNNNVKKNWRIAYECVEKNKQDEN